MNKKKLRQINKISHAMNRLWHKRRKLIDEMEAESGEPQRETEVHKVAGRPRQQTNN